MSAPSTPVMEYTGRHSLPEDHADRTELVKAVHATLNGKVPCPCGKGNFGLNGLVNGVHYRFKCRGCSTTIGVPAFLDHVRDHLARNNRDSINIRYKKQVFILKFAEATDLTPELDADQPAPAAAACDLPGPDNRRLFAGSTPKKRRMEDTLSQDEAESLVENMSHEELSRFALETHAKLIDTEARFAEVQSQLKAQSLSIAQQNDRITQQDDRLAQQQERITQQDDRFAALEARVDAAATMPVPATTAEPTPAPAGQDRTAPRQSTWASVVLRNVPEARHAEVTAARSALRAKPVRRPTPARTEAERQTGTRIVHVSGIQRMRYRDIKGHLKSLGFSISKIPSISFVGYATEFVVEEDYSSLFVHQIETRVGATVLHDFDPTASHGTSTVNPKVACGKRLKAIFERETTPLIVKHLISALVEEKELTPEFDAAVAPVQSEAEAPAQGDVDAVMATADAAEGAPPAQ